MTEPIDETPWTDDVSVGIEAPPAHDDDTAPVPPEETLPEDDGSTDSEGVEP